MSHRKGGEGEDKGDDYTPGCRARNDGDSESL